MNDPESYASLWFLEFQRLCNIAAGVASAGVGILKAVHTIVSTTRLWHEKDVLQMS